MLIVQLGLAECEIRTLANLVNLPDVHRVINLQHKAALLALGANLHLALVISDDHVVLTEVLADNALA